MNNNGRTFNSIKNIFFAVGNQLCMIFLNIFSRTVFIKILGVEYLGINGLFSDILTMLSLADLGLGTAMVYSFYKPLADNDEAKLSALVGYYKKIYNLIAISVAAVGIAIVPFLNLIVKTDRTIPYLQVYYLLFLANTVISYLFVYKSSIISSDQKNYIISMYSMIVNVIRIIVQTVFLIFTHNYFIYLAIQVIATLAGNFFIAYSANKLYPFINIKAELSKSERRDIFGNIKSVFIYKLSGVLLNGTDNIFISLLVGTVYVGYYSNYKMVIGMASMFITLIFSSLDASIGNLIVKDSCEKRFELFKILQLVSFWIGSFCTISLYILINHFIELWLGSQFLFGKAVLIAILLNFYIACTFQPMWSYRDAAGLYSQTKYIMLIAAAANLVLSIAFGKMWGVSGILFASAAARLSTYLLYEPRLLFKQYFNAPHGEYYLDHLANIILFLIAACITNCFVNLVDGNNWASFFIKGAICLVIPNVIYFIFNRRKKEFKVLTGKFSDLCRLRERAC